MLVEKEVIKIIKGELKKSESEIRELIKTFNYSKTHMAGFNDNLIEIKEQIEKLYDRNYYLGHSLDNAPFFGWKQEDLNNMWEIHKEINKRFIEIYAIALCGLGEREEPWT